LKGSADHDIGVGGADLAAQALRAGLVDECHLFVAPVVVGSGKPLFPNDLFLTLDLLDVRRFDSGMVYLRYHIRT
jgi:dihydrofolate reductase